MPQPCSSRNYTYVARQPWKVSRYSRFFQIFPSFSWSRVAQRPSNYSPHGASVMQGDGRM